MSTSITPNEDILSDFEVELDPAGRGQRFINFLVDRVLFYFFTKAFDVFWVKVLTTFMYGADYYTMLTVTVIVYLFLYGLFMGIIEALSKGKSLGKLFTGTRAVNPDGTPISYGKAFLRGFSRMVPLEPFSAFGGDWPRPWHDKWTNTYVVVEKTSTLPQ